MAPIKFAELCAQSCYSFLEGASMPEDLFKRAAQLEYEAIALTDLNGVYGLARAFAAAAASPSSGPRLIAGAQIQWQNSPLYLLAENRAGYGNLCELLSAFHTEEKLLLEKFAAGLSALYAPLTDDRPSLGALQDLFTDRLSLVGSLWLDGQDQARLARIETLARDFALPIVASCQPLFHHPARKPLQDVLTAIRHIQPVAQLGLRRLPNAERHLKTLPQIAALFARYPSWIRRSLEIAARCRFSLSELRYQYPSEWLPAHHTSESYLRELTYQGAQARYPGGVPPAVASQIEAELALIQELRYEDYFLTIWDIVQFARGENILCQGRGSAANSVVCFTLGITSIDPMRQDLLFERFISRERSEPPDIDIDFEHERREEVIQYIYRRYGRMRAAITAENICFRKRSAMREVGKALEIPLPVVEGLLTLSHRRSLSEISTEELDRVRQDIPPEQLLHYLSLVDEIQGFPRHLGTHVGGFVLSQEKLSRFIPIEKAAMPDRTIVQWDKNDLDTVGVTRVDILGLGILTAIRKCFDLVKTIYGRSYTLATIPAEDKRVYDAICRADTIGTFQIESRAQMNMLPRLKPQTFYDLVVEISLVRPGPIQGEMVHPYLKRRTGQEKVEYPHPALEAILKKTCGVPLFQEQIMAIAMRVAGFTGGEADELRRSMGIWRRDGRNHLSRMCEKFKVGLLKNGIQPDFADRILSQIQGFAEYGFPESHAASFAILAYASCYLKTYYPDAYATALLNSQPMGFYQSHTILYDAIRHGVRVLPVDVRKSGWDNRLVDKMTIRLGFREIRGVSEKLGRIIETETGPAFSSLEDFAVRVHHRLDRALSKRELLLLAAANAFQGLGLERRLAFWEIQKLQIDEPSAFQTENENLALPLEDDWEKIRQDLDALGVTLAQHPMHFLRKEVSDLGAKDSRAINQTPNGRRVKAAGIVISRQMPPTANGVLFITLEDEHGFINLVIWNKVFQKFREVLLTQCFLLVAGKIQKATDGDVIHLIVDQAAPLLTQAPTLPSKDFA